MNLSAVPAHENSAGVSSVQTSKNVHQAGFARPIFAQECMNFAVMQFEVRSIQGDGVSELLLGTFNAYRRAQNLGGKCHGRVRLNRHNVVAKAARAPEVWQSSIEQMHAGSPFRVLERKLNTKAAISPRPTASRPSATNQASGAVTSAVRAGVRAHTLTARVLVVDDDATIRDVLVEALGMEAYEARGAMNGRDALQIMSNWSPDVIVLDLMMPELDGWGFRSEQRQRPEWREIPVIMLSAARNLEEHIEALAPAAWFAKPFDLDAVLQAVNAAANDEPRKGAPTAS